MGAVDSVVYLIHTLFSQFFMLYVAKNLNLDTLDNRRRHQKLKFMYRTVKGSIPALPTETFFRPQKTNKTHIQPKHFPDHVSSIFFQQLTTNNPRCFLVPTAHTEQFKGNQKGNIKCYARERANTKQPF